MFTRLSTELSRRAARAMTNYRRIQSDTLRAHLWESFESTPGSEHALLADPVFESTFGYVEDPDVTVATGTTPKLHKKLVDAMDVPGTGPRLPRDVHPYTHQLESWKKLQQTPRRSVVVSSGTGSSAKTECASHEAGIGQVALFRSGSACLTRSPHNITREKHDSKI